MPTQIVKSPDVWLANPVTLRVTPPTVDAALEQSLNVDASALMKNEDSPFHAG